MKIRTPKLRTVLVAMAALVVVLAALQWSANRREIANQRASGLAAVEAYPAEGGGGGGTRSGVIAGIIGGATKVARHAPNAQAMTYLSSREDADKAPSPQVDKKVIRNAELSLIVSDVVQATQRIRALVEASGGDIDRLTISQTDDGARAAEIVLRVPARGLDNALDQIKRVAQRTERENVATRDVTSAFYDNEAHMRNLRAEEAQYLAIMRQAHTVKDTLEVSEKLSDVRDRIERLQTEINVMSHDIEMSVVAITLSLEPRLAAWEWRPLHNARLAARDMFIGLGDWVDWLVSIIIHLPVIAAWLLTLLGASLAAWKSVRWGWRKLRPVSQEQA